MSKILDEKLSSALDRLDKISDKIREAEAFCKKIPNINYQFYVDDNVYFTFENKRIVFSIDSVKKPFIEMDALCRIKYHVYLDKFCDGLVSLLLLELEDDHE